MDRLAHLLEATTGGGDAVKAATAALEEEQKGPGFGSQLLALCSVVPVAGYSLPAATYFKNYVWTNRFKEERGTGIPPAERATVRIQLLETVMRADGLVLKQLAEALRVLVLQDFRDAAEWPELVPQVRSAIQHSNLMGGMQASPVKTYNALVAVHTLSKPFQYFQKPAEVSEPVPPQLESISEQLLEPLQSIYQALVQQALASHAAGLAEHDALLHLLLKALHHTIRSHLPVSLLPHLPTWLQGVLALLGLPVFPQRDLEDGHVLRLRLVKRALQICASMVARHRKQADKYMQQMVTAAVTIVTAAVGQQHLHSVQERIVSLAFDLLAAILETGPGWRLLAPHLDSLLAQALFPALTLQEQDVTEWQEDPVSYVSKNLPDDMDDVSGWRDDLFSPRRSAQNLLGLIALAKVPESSRPVRKVAKRPHQTSSKDVTAGERILLPALNQHAIPAGAETSQIAQYYGVLQAYGALQKFYSQTQKPGAAVAMLRARVLPLYRQPAPSPLLLATANWLLGEYAEDLATAAEAGGLAGDTLRAQVYDLLLKALAFPDGEELDGGPVRSSAAGAMQALLVAEFHPPDWLPLLQAAVAASRSTEDEENARAFQLLQAAAESGNEEVARHAPALLPVLMSAVVERLPEERSATWPAVAESGVAALTQLVATFDEAAEEKDDTAEEEEPAPYLPTPSEQAAVADCIASFLQRAWLPPPGAPPDPELPSDSCLHDNSVLLASLLKHTVDRSAVERRRVSALLAVWAGLLREWDAWAVEEDSAALGVIDQAIEKQKSALLPHFITAPTPPPPLPPVPPQSPLEAIAAFLADAIESVRAEGVWRACYRVHALLHASAMAFEGHEATKAVVHRVAAACASRLHVLSSPAAPLAKPLVLAIATCFLCNPAVAVPALASALGAKAENGRGQETRAGVVEWAVRLAEVVKREEHGLTDQTECQLAVAALLKVVDTLVAAGGGPAEAGVAAAALEGAMRALVREKELREEDSGMEEGDESDGEEEEEEEKEEGEEGEEGDDASDQEETEAEFLERYAAVARGLEEGEDDREGGSEEDGQPLELGVLGLVDSETALLGCLKSHGKAILAVAPIQDGELLNSFVTSMPEAASYLRQS